MWVTGAVRYFTSYFYKNRNKILQRDWSCLAEAPPMTRIRVCCVVIFTREWSEFHAQMNRVNSKCYSLHSRLVWTHLYSYLYDQKCSISFFCCSCRCFARARAHTHTHTHTPHILAIQTCHHSLFIIKKKKLSWLVNNMLRTYCYIIYKSCSKYLCCTC